MNNNNQISRREALKFLGTGTLGLFAATAGVSSLATACASKGSSEIKETNVGLRKDPKSGNMVSLLGFGCMRFPLTGEGVIDEELSQQLIDYAYAHGVNYFDTAWGYIKGTSEPFTGKALKKYPRESFYLATKMPTWLIDSLDKAKETFQAQLDRLQTTYIDYYLLHALGKKEEYIKVYKENNVLDYLKEEKAAGRIKRLGFSFHGDNDTFDFLLGEYDWDFVQIQLNYYDWDGDDAKTLYRKLEERGIPAIIMEPVRGGMLAKLNPDAENILKKSHPNQSVASWAFRYCASLPGVLTILSGMNVMDHVKENISTLSPEFKPLTANEHSTLDEALRIFRQNPPLRCTTCKYCIPCPVGVDIPTVFTFYNNCINDSKIPDFDYPKGREFRKRKTAFLARYSQIPEESRPDRCTKCNKCKKLCPQHIDIPTQLAKIVEMVEKAQKS